ncbi:alpha/beta fold hydrolase, partial [Oenococcus oeni]
MANFQTNDKVRIKYHIQGKEDGQALIFIEGYSGNEATWAAQINDFVKAGFKVITYDRRNHGKSQSVPYGMQIARHGFDLAELINHLKLKKPVLIGHSMG